MKRFWPFSFYFLYFVAFAGFAPYVVLYWQSQGFTGPQIGFLTFIPPLVTLVSAPLWTGFADARHIHRLLMALAIAGTAGFAAALPFVHTFGAALVMSPVLAFFSAPIMAMSDTATMHSLAQEGQPQMYGRVRLGGTFGWALASPLVGALAEAKGVPWAFWSYAGGLLLALLVSLRFTYPSETRRVPVTRGMQDILGDRGWVFFLLLGLVSGMGFASVNNYFFAYMNELNMGTTLAGIALTISTVAEIPVMFFSNRILARLGARGMLTLSAGATGLRLLGYALFTSPAGILVLQLANGLTFPAFWIAGVAYANEHSPRGMQASAQGLFGAATMGVGAALGGLLAGILLGSIGGQKMYAVFGGIVLVGLVILTGLEKAMGRRPA